jgi:hypothetical protein
LGFLVESSTVALDTTGTLRLAASMVTGAACAVAVAAALLSGVNEKPLLVDADANAAKGAVEVLAAAPDRSNDAAIDEAEPNPIVVVEEPDINRYEDLQTNSSEHQMEILPLMDLMAFDSSTADRICCSRSVICETNQQYQCVIR